MNPKSPRSHSSVRWTGRLTDRTILRALVVGFSVVGVLLSAATLVAVRDSRAIRRGTALLAREQLEMARLLHEVPVQENRLTEQLESSSARLSAAEAEIERQSAALANESAILLGACFALASLCAVATILFTARSIRRIESQADDLSRVSWHMLRGQEEVARRFSHELHDELGQSLAAVRSSLSRGNLDDDRREDCLRLVDHAIANVRELSQLLRPVILDDFGLDAGLRWLVEKFAQRTGIEADFHSDLTFRFEDEVETHLFRIAQEALTNIARHSGATRIRIALDAPSPSGEIRLVIEDNGRGLRIGPDATAPTLGMTGMRARATRCGGDLAIQSATPTGLRLTVSIPPPHRTTVEG